MSDSSVLPHPRALAHLGDAVYELWVRELAIQQCHKAADLHRFTTERVNAQIQAVLLAALWETLTDTEKALVQRARNMPVSTGRRAQQQVHRQATALEALIGYWHWQDPAACRQQQSRLMALLPPLPECLP